MFVPSLTHLPTVAELAAAAARCARPVILWVIDMDLRITACAGQLAALAGGVTGRNILDVLGSTDPAQPSVNALRRAFLGEVVYYQTDTFGIAWDACYAPIVDARRVRGVIGQATLRHTTPSTNPEQPFVYRVNRDADGFHQGEILTRPRRAYGTIRRHDAVSLDAFDHLLAIGALTPVPSVASYEADERCAQEADGQVARLPRGFLRLVPREA